jgi:hypothetical protein
MTSPQFDPAQQHTQMDPQGGANQGGYGPQNPYSYGQPYGSPQVPPSGPPAYGSPQMYQPQAYGQPVYPGYPAPGYPAPAAQTNTMAILALVFAFVFSPLGIVFGHMAKRQIARTGEQGGGLATAGLVLGYIFTGILVAWCAFWVIFAGVVAGSVGTTP